MLTQILAEPESAQELRRAGLYPGSGVTAQFGKPIAADIERYAAVTAQPGSRLIERRPAVDAGCPACDAITCKGGLFCFRHMTSWAIRRYSWGQPKSQALFSSGRPVLSTGGV